MEQRYYYKDNRNNYCCYKEEHGDLIPITEQEWNEHLALVQPKPLTEAQKTRAQTLKQINVLKKNLADTDYQAIKYAEGMISAEDYASMKAQRQSWRDEINQLEETL